jgi:hypothetical protein
MNRVLLAAFVGMMLLTIGCKSGTDNNDALRNAVVKHIASMNGLNLNNMTITLTQATVHGDQAEAKVDIRAKDSDPSAPAMQLVYQMQKQGKEWVVVKGQPLGGMQHPAPGEMPAADLPPGHPASGQAPGRQPDFNAILNTARQNRQAPAQQTPPGSQQEAPAQNPSSDNAKP